MKSRKNALTDYLQSLYNIPTLTQAEEVGLAHLIAQGDDYALEKLVTHNLRFVVSVIKKMPNWSHSNMPMEDLLSFGNEALMNAARKWQPQGKIRFASYAKKFIQLDVQRGVANTKNIIRLPVNITEEVRRIKYATRMLTQELGRTPTDRELATKLNVSSNRIAYINSILNKEPVSLEIYNSEHLDQEGQDD
jgi:DNA-directed RNA polymerase sigma subunit (sigma70/sigma32)